MILKSFLLLSILLASFGLGGSASVFDNAIKKAEFGDKSKVSASNLPYTLPTIKKAPKAISFSDSPNIYASRYLLADLDSGEELIRHNANEKVPIASTTKIMTAVVVLENYILDDVAIISEKSAYQAGADAYLKVGERMVIKNLLYCMLIKSGNDAAYALAEHYSGDGSGDVKSFVNLMNKKAYDLGMHDTQYLDPAGLDTNGYSSAHDLFTITKYALKFKQFSDIVATAKIVVTNTDGSIYHQLDNSNRLVGEYNYMGAIGVKTGYMPEAGHCLVAAAKRDGRTLIAIILKTDSDTSSASADEAKKLLDWGWTNISWD